MYVENIKKYRKKEIEILERLNLEQISRAMEAIVETWEKDADIYVFGNGGSAATASHMANDFNKGISEKTGKKFRMHCLCDNFSTVMAIANDSSYEEIFRFQLKGILRKDDLVIGISGSGNSENVLKAIEYAKSQNVRTVGITGYDGGMLQKIADYSMHVPVIDMQITEDIHMFFDHMMMHILSARYGR